MKTRPLLAAIVISFAVLLAAYANAQTPSFQWAKRIASTTNEDFEPANGLAMDSAANLYVTGWFDGTNDFGGVVLTNTPGGGQDIFVAKYNSTGALQWAHRAGGSSTNQDAGRGAGVDTNGNVYVTGEFYGPADFGGFNLLGSTRKQFFLVKYDSVGTVQWTRESVGGRGVYGTGLAVDSAGNSYAVGYANNGATVTFETTNLLNTNFNGYSTFLVKYDNAGEVQWAQLFDSPVRCYSTSVVVDGAGNVYVPGSFNTSLNIGATNFTNAGDKDGFVAKFNSAGVLQWAQQMTGPSDCGGLGSVSVDAPGSVYVAGGFGNTAGDTISFGSSITLTNIGGGILGTGAGDAFLAKYDGSTGTVQWARRAGGTNLDGYTGVATDSQGNVYVGGGSGGTDFLGSFNALVAKYDSNGVVQWTQSSTGTNGLVFGGPVVDISGNCYVAGWFHTNAVFGATTLTGQGYWDFFLAKLGFTPHANLDGCDDFNDNFKDPTRWGPVFAQGCCGLLTETNGRLEFTKSSGTSSALVAQPWILNFGSYTQNWEVQIDASVPPLGFPESVFGLGVASGTSTDFNNTNSDSNNRFSIALFESDTPSRIFLSRFGVKGGSFDRMVELDTTSTFAGLRITFDASTKVLSAFYDEDGPVSGYSWTLLGSTNISTAWGMTLTNVFGVWVHGRVEGDTVVSADNVFGENFCASSGLTPLMLGIAWSNSLPRLSVSGEISNRFVLEYVSALAASNNWQSLVTNTLTNNPFILTDTNAGGSSKRFYRARLVP